MRSLIWFDIVDEQYNDELWYANFRIMKRTFEFIFDKVQQEICRKSTPMRDPVIAKRRLAITNIVVSNLIRQTTVSLTAVLLLFFQDEYACVINFRSACLLFGGPRLPLRIVTAR